MDFCYLSNAFGQDYYVEEGLYGTWHLASQIPNLLTINQQWPKIAKKKSNYHQNHTITVKWEEQRKRLILVCKHFVFLWYQNVEIKQMCTKMIQNQN